MNKDEFSEGWRMFLAGLGKDPNSKNYITIAKEIYPFFTDRNYEHFLKACKNLAEHGVDKFQPLSNIQNEMKNIAVDYCKEEKVIPEVEENSGPPPEFREILKQWGKEKKFEL